MKEKIEKEFSRLELAKYLEQLAGQIRSGSVDAVGGKWSIPEKFQAKVRHKEKKGRFETKLKWYWSSLADYDAPAREEVTRWQESFKTIKKRLAAQFKVLQKTVQDGHLPDAKMMLDFETDSRRMAEDAEEEWQPAMDEYMDHLENFKRAVNQQQLEVVQHELRDLRNRMIQCHRDYK